MLNEKQEEHVGKVLSSNPVSGELISHLLEAGPGCGKTFVASYLMAEIMSRGHTILSLYPSHAARLVAIEEVLETFGDDCIRTVGDVGDGKDTHVSLRHKTGGGSVTFLTIHSFLNIRPFTPPGKYKAISSQDYAGMEELIDKLVKTGATYVFIDELSMISTDQLVADSEPVEGENGRAIYKGLVTVLQAYLNSTHNKGIVLHCTGDFDQLEPVGGKTCIAEFGHDPETDTVLDFNYRSRTNPQLQDLIKFIKDKGRMPKGKKREDFEPGVRFIDSEQQFRGEFRGTLKKNPGPNVVAINYTNKSRSEFEAIASEVFSGKSTPIFKGANLTAAEAKSGDLEITMGRSGKFNIINSEGIEILEEPVLEKIPGTKWTSTLVDSDIKAYKARVKAKVSGTEFKLYVTPFMGEASTKIVDKCPAAALTVAAGTMYSAITALDTVAKLAELRELLLSVPLPMGTLRGIKGMGTVHPARIAPMLRDIRQASPEKILQSFYDVLVKFVGGASGEALSILGTENKLFMKVAASYLILAMEDKNQLHSVIARRAEYMCKSIPSLFWASVVYSTQSILLKVRIRNSLTCHNAQGQGRDHAFLNAREIEELSKNFKNKQKQLLYVGASRAKKELTVLI